MSITKCEIIWKICAFQLSIPSYPLKYCQYNLTEISFLHLLCRSLIINHSIYQKKFQCFRQNTFIPNCAWELCYRYKKPKTTFHHIKKTKIPLIIKMITIKGKMFYVL